MNFWMAVMGFGLVALAIASFVSDDLMQSEIKRLRAELKDWERKYGKGDTWTTPQ